jgi:hypothetical protein
MHDRVNSNGSVNSLQDQPSDLAGGDPGSARPRLKLDLVRDIDGAMYLETFLVAAVVAVLGIRLYLEVMGYPRLGPGGLHIAHMLWGGVLMLIALVLVLAFLGKRMKHTAAVVGGLGFGAFIDELGKFLTADNDYFYRPTIGLIYVILIVLFLIFRQIQRRRHFTRSELLANAADMLREVVIDGAQSAETARALALLERSGYRTELAHALRGAVLSADVAPENEPSLAARVTALARRVYGRLVGLRWFHRAIVLAFTANAAGSIIAAVGSLSVGSFGPLTSDDRSFATLAQLAGSLATSAMTIGGVVFLTRSHLRAYRWFKRSVLVTIFFVQVFLFFENQLAALGGLAVNLVMLAGLNAMLAAEHVRDDRSAGLAPQVGPAAATITPSTPEHFAANRRMTE